MTASVELGVRVNLPYKWRPRDYQLPAWRAWERGIKRSILVWHRRAGKDLTSVNWMVQAAVERPGLYWHVSPTYAQGRKIVWEGKDKGGRPFLEYIPNELIVRKRDDEMKIWLQGGSQIQVIGAEEPDRLVGANPVGIILSEYSVQNPRFWTLMRPILSENGGWAIFCYTPRGRNHGYKLYRAALGLGERWFTSLLTVDDTHAIPMEAIDDDRASGMPEETIQQEYWCSFDAAMVGSYYGNLIVAAEKEGRIGKVPWEPTKPVHTAWDLGIGDLLSIWFLQRVGAERRVIDFYMNSGQGLEHYVKVLRDKPYIYEPLILPHDAKVRELSTKKTRVQFLSELGMKSRVLPKYALNDGIAAVRALLPTCYFDELKCEDGLGALREYQKQPMEDERGPNGEPIFLDAPLHNWASHPADAFRYMALGLKNPSNFGSGPQRPGDGRQKLRSPLAIV